MHYELELTLWSVGALALIEWIRFPARFDVWTSFTCVAWFLLGVLTTVPSAVVQAPVFSWCVSHHVVGWLAAWPLLAVFDDFSMYCSHRLSHRWRPWWFAHRPHHSSTTFNYLVALRASPLEAVFLLPFLCVPLLLGCSIKALAVERFVSICLQHLMHTRVRWNVPRCVSAVLVTPEFHELHHGSNRIYWDCNYGAVLSVWDHWFGTAVERTEIPVYGVA